MTVICLGGSILACQAREGNLQEFFRHENHGSPPSLSCTGKMRFGQKSELVQLLEASTTVERPDVDVKVFDATAVVNMLPPGKSKTIMSSSKHRISKE